MNNVRFCELCEYRQTGQRSAIPGICPPSQRPNPLSQVRRGMADSNGRYRESRRSASARAASSPLFSFIAGRRPVESRGLGADSRQRVLPTRSGRSTSPEAVVRNQPQSSLPSTGHTRSCPFEYVTRKHGTQASRSLKHHLQCGRDHGFASLSTHESCCESFSSWSCSCRLSRSGIYEVSPPRRGKQDPLHTLTSL